MLPPTPTRTGHARPGRPSSQGLPLRARTHARTHCSQATTTSSMHVHTQAHTHTRAHTSAREAHWRACVCAREEAPRPAPHLQAVRQRQPLPVVRRRERRLRGQPPHSRAGGRWGASEVQGGERRGEGGGDAPAPMSWPCAAAHMMHNDVSYAIPCCSRQPPATSRCDGATVAHTPRTPPPLPRLHVLDPPGWPPQAQQVLRAGRTPTPPALRAARCDQQGVQSHGR